MCGALSTKRPQTGGSETRVRGKNGVAVKNGACDKNGAVKKSCVLCKSDAPDRNDALKGDDAPHNAAIPRQPPRRRAKPNGPSALHTLETCVHYFHCLPRNTNKPTDRDAGCFDAPCRPRDARSDRGPRVRTAECAAAARGRSRVSGLD